MCKPPLLSQLQPPPQMSPERQAVIAAQRNRDKLAAADQLLRIKLELSKHSIQPSIPGKK